MPRRQPASLYLVPPAAEPQGLVRWRTFLKNLIRKPASPGAVPHDLIADVLADNGLRAREQERRQPQISGRWI